MRRARSKENAPVARVHRNTICAVLTATQHAVSSYSIRPGHRPTNRVSPSVNEVDSEQLVLHGDRNLCSTDGEVVEFLGQLLVLPIGSCRQQT
jgi:hypothetical protein